MLQLRLKDFDLCRVTKLLAKHHPIKARVTNDTIVFYDDVSDEVLSELFNNVSVNSAENYIDESFSDLSSTINDEYKQKQVNVKTQDYDLLFPTVKRGEVYLCDFGDPYGSEQGYKRYAIIIQNDVGNSTSPCTIVLVCTTKPKKNLPIHYGFNFSEENMEDYNPYRVSSKHNFLLCEQIRTIDKKRLRKYVGRMTPTFMEEIQPTIDISLGISRKEKQVTEIKEIVVEKPVYKNCNVTKNISILQIQLLSSVDINELIRISETTSSNQSKVDKMLDLFGFDLSQNGVQYLKEAILNSPKSDYFNLETLCEDISRNASIEKEEVQRLIVARVKERFKLKKSTIDFIRLINSFLIKQ